MSEQASAKLPLIIQGGMGVSISWWKLANTVSSLGQLGLVAGTALDRVMVRRLQHGDPGGHYRRAFDAFPFREMAERAWSKYFKADGLAAGEAYLNPGMHDRELPRELGELCLISNFVEVWLAKEGHSNPVGINYLEKIQPPHLVSAYGAMLAGVDFVVMGAGIPMRIPGALDKFVNHETATYPLYVAGATADDDTTMTFNPRDYMECDLPPLKRPMFLPIIASNVLAQTLAKKANGRVDGFVIEGPTAGGHNAPPRGKLQLNERGEPIYGERDIVDLAKMRELGLPFWLAGGFGHPEQLRYALSEGAAGIQVGTAFAYSAESGMRPDYRREVLNKAKDGTVDVFTDPLASPSGFPFKVVQLEGSASDEKTYKARPRICDLGYLREAYKSPEGKIAFRCASEPVSVFLSKGGSIEETEGRKCICNALMATMGTPQSRAGGKIVEAGIVTSGDDLTKLRRFMPENGTEYHAADVIRIILSGLDGTEFEHLARANADAVAVG
jgi:nitronate monooxygenase